MAISRKNLYQLTVNPDSTFDTGWPLGNKPPGSATLDWADDLQPLIDAIDHLTTGSTFSHDVRQYLTGTAAATATITIITVSGDNAALEGWTIGGGGDDLEHPGNNTGSGFFRLRATNAGDAVDTPPLQWAWAAPPVVTDELEPTIPTGFTVTPYEGGVTFSHDASSDKNDESGVAASLLKQYRYYRNGSQVATNAASSGLSGAFQTWTIGTFSPAPGFTQLGNRFTVHASGTGNDGTSDQLYMIGRAISGNFVATCKVTSTSGAVSEYAPAGLMCRESSAAGSKYFCGYQWHTALDRGWQGKKRVATNGARTSLASNVGTGAARWLRLARAGDTFTIHTSADGGAWSLLLTDTLAMNADVIVGLFTTALQAGTTEITSIFDEFNLTLSSGITYDYDTVVGGSWTAKAEDNDDNLSGATPAVSADPLDEVPDMPLTKWHPGHYIITYTLNSLPSNQIQEVKDLKTASGGDVQGVGLWYSWRFLEPTRGNYSGISSLVTAVNQLWAQGLRAYIFIVDDTFGGTTRYVPDYLTSEPDGSPGIYNKINGGTTPVIWVQAIMDRCIALFQQLGAALDEHPAVEIVSYRELDPGFGTNEYAGANYSDTGYLNQLKRWVVAAKAAFPHTNLIAPGNYIGSQGTMVSWVDFCYQNRVGIGGPDVYVQPPYRTSTSTQSATWTDQVLKGNQWNGSAWV